MPEQLAGDKEALRLAWDEASGRDPGQLARDAGASMDPDGTIRLRLMDRGCAVDIPARAIVYEDDGSPLRAHVRVLVLHYLLGSSRSGATGEMVTFREFPGGALYYPAYRKRTLDIIVSKFGRDLEPLRRAGERIGAVRLERAAVAFRTRFFPKLDVDLLMWAGDDEVPSSANLLFDSGAIKTLSTEDVTVVAGLLCSRVVALSKG